MGRTSLVTSACAMVLSGAAILAQAPAPQQQPPAGAAGAGGRAQGAGRGGPAIVSPEIGADGRVTFRISAPQATTVTVGGDVAGGLVPAAGAPAPAATPAAPAAPARHPHPAGAAAARRP